MSIKSTRSLPVPPLAIVILTVAIEVTGSGILFPVLPFLVQQFRSDAFTIGLLASSFAIAQFLAAPLLGIMSDRYGRRPIILTCAAGTSIAFFTLGLANTLWLMFVAQIVNGVTGGVLSTAQAYIADISTSPQERTKNFGLIGVAAGIGFIMGPLLGGSLASIDLKLPALIAGFVALLNTTIGYFVLPESLHNLQPTPLKPKELNPFLQIARLFADPKLRNLLTGYFAFYLAFAGFTSIFVVFARDRFGWGPAASAGVAFWVGVVAIIVQGGLIRKLLPRFGEIRLTVAGLSAMSIAIILVALSPKGYYLYGTQSLFAFGVGIASPSLRGIISNSVGDNEQGKVSGGSQSLTSLTQILGPMMAGSAYDRFGPRVPLLLEVLLLLWAIALVWRARRSPSF